MMKEYTVAYIKDTEEYAYDTYIAGTAIGEIAEELTYNMNRYGVDYNEIVIFDVNDEKEANVYFYKVVNIDGKYQLEA
jgi:hypothetical protein